MKKFKNIPQSSSDENLKECPSPYQSLKRILKYISANYKKQFVCVVLLIFVSSIVSVVSSAFMGLVIDNILTPIKAGTMPLNDLYLSVAILLVVFIIGAFASYGYNRIMLVIAQGILKQVRDDMFEHMQTLPIRYFDNNTDGSVMSKYTNDTDTLRQMLSQSLPNVISSAITVIGVFLAMCFYSVVLTFIIVVFVIFEFYIIKKIGSKSVKYFLRQQESIGNINGYIEEMMEGQKVVKVFCHENKAKADFDKINDGWRDDSAKANTYAQRIMPVLGNLSYVQYILVAIIGVIFALTKINCLSLYCTVTGQATFSIGAVITFMQLTKSFNMPISNCSQQINYIFMSMAGAERIFELLDEPAEVNDGKTTLVKGEFENGAFVAKEKGNSWAWKVPADNGYKFVELKGDIRFNNVVFGYNDDKIILNNISLYAKPGQKIAFVGSTGAGKTTITNLINRFYDIQSGEILYDGLDIKSINKKDLRHSLGIVLQDTHLFTGTVMDNIRYGRLDATDEECIEAAKLANADFFISRLPQGYDTMLSGDGGNLSQGQRQLLSIARAAVSKCPVLILDEATSSIDTRTEKLIEQGMNKLMENRTVFVIAHRLSTIRSSEAIMVLEHGEIIERGNHEDLIKQKGKYYQLYTGTFELD